MADQPNRNPVRGERHMRGARLAAIATLALAATSGIAQGAALERAVPQVVRLLYEQGTYGEFGLSFVDPHQSGEGAVLPTPAGPLALPGDTGDLFQSHTSYFAAVKGDIGDRLSYVVGFDQPQGVATLYSQGTFASTALSYAGTQGQLRTYQFTGVLAYDVNDRVKLYAGLRAERVDAKADVPIIAGYTVDVDDNWGYGYLIGAAYARPEIALRVGLTYSSAINHDVDATEDAAVIPSPEDSTFSLDMPQSVTLDFQTGVAPKTLVFGSVRWVNWADFAIAPPLFVQLAGQPLVDYQDDWWTYTLGVGRQLTPELAGSFFVAWEPPVGGTMTTLGPYDGRTTGTAALSYDYGKFNFTGALTYGVLGDTTNRFETDFNDGWVWGAAFRVGYNF